MSFHFVGGRRTKCLDNRQMSKDFHTLMTNNCKMFRLQNIMQNQYVKAFLLRMMTIGIFFISFPIRGVWYSNDDRIGAWVGIKGQINRFVDETVIMSLSFLKTFFSLTKRSQRKPCKCFSMAEFGKQGIRLTSTRCRFTVIYFTDERAIWRKTKCRRSNEVSEVLNSPR